MNDPDTRTEKDSLGEVEVPADALYGAQTQRAVQNFTIGGGPMPARFVRALALVKKVAARVNTRLGVLDADVGRAIEEAAAEVVDGGHAEQFPVDVYQTGSGTSTNMNLNEVLARRAGQRLGREVHPNDAVNRGQSSNDVIPTAIHLSASVALRQRLRPALEELEASLSRKAREFGDVVKTGRTHLMDATPITLGQELSAFAQQIRSGLARLASTEPRLHALAMGGTAVGTGLNAHPRFAEHFVRELSRETGIEFRRAADPCEAIACQDTAVELSGQFKTVAVSLMKICNDLRWMNSGPLAGLGELRLPALQPGSSIMPGKVNPVIPEAVAMAAARVIGNDTTITVAGQSGNFQLNVMLPVIADCLLQSARLLSRGSRLLARRAVEGLQIDRARMESLVARNPMLVTALAPRIGYDRAAKIAHTAMERGLDILQVARESSGLDESELQILLDPRRLTSPGDEAGTAEGPSGTEDPGR